ncbi:MAG: polysaccharide deacetylase family protein [Pseudomonadota bacterium]
MRRLLRNTFYGVLHYSGINAWWRARHKDHLTVLFAHGICASGGTDGMPPSRWQLSDAQLEQQLAQLVGAYTFVSLDDAQRVIRGELVTPKPAALFTMDDAYTSAYRLAWPVLKRFDIPAVVFVATNQMRSEEPFWWDRLDYAFLHMREPVDHVQLGPHRIDVKTGSRQERANSARYVTRHSRQLFDREPERFAALYALIAQYEDASSLPALNAWTGVMGAAEVVEADADGMTIGSHTVNHYRLAQLDGDALADEMTQSKSELETLLGKPCPSLCYPEGSVSATSAKAAAQAGYEVAFVSDRGLNPVGADPMTLKRIHLPERAGTAELAVLVSGLGDRIARFKKQLTASKQA